MELSNQIKAYRTKMALSQEELAEQVYVTRQTVSNWENNKSYPDIRSLLLLSSLFEISLDQLIKGDIEMMREEISKDAIHKFNRDSAIFSFLLVLFVLSVVPLLKFFDRWGILISAAIYGAAAYYGFKVEKQKKKYNLQTYREIIAFTEGKKLDEIASAREYGKRPYQKLLIVLCTALIALAVCVLMIWLLKVSPS